MPNNCAVDEKIDTPNPDEHDEVTEDVIRERSYLLWEQAGRPEFAADQFWYEAQAEILGIE